MRAALAFAAMVAASSWPLAGMQSLSGGQSSSGAKQAAVTYLFPEQVTVVADKASPVDLHFKIAAGLHINSHTPHTEDLIPTTFKVPESSGVTLAKADFPAGKDFAFELDPKDKLSVYTGEFIIHTELLASKGEHLVEATLKYQACDNQTCMPPKSIPVAIDVIAK